MSRLATDRFNIIYEFLIEIYNILSKSDLDNEFIKIDTL